MFGMIKNSLFGNTEKTEYKLLSSETKVRDVRAGASCQFSHPALGGPFARHAVFSSALRALWRKVLQKEEAPG